MAVSRLSAVTLLLLAAFTWSPVSLVSAQHVTYQAARTVDNLAEFGCVRLLPVVQKLRAVSQARRDGMLYRAYNYEGIDVVTRAIEREIIHGSKASIDALRKIGILQSMSDIKAFIEKFGNSYRREGESFIFLPESEDFGPVMIYVNVINERISTVEWSCG